MMCLLVFVGIISLCFFVIDFVMAFQTWQSRIHIGRWKDRKEWQKAVERKARQWLKHSPTVKITDQSRLILWDILRGRYRSNNIQSWQDAGLLFGLSHEDALSYVDRHKGLFSQKNLNVDCLLLAYALKRKGVLNRENEIRIKKFFAPYIEKIQTVPYRKNIPNIRFVDTIGLICPFLCCVGYEEIALRQIKDFDEVLLQEVYPPHAYDIGKKIPLGVFDWSRGIGWYVLGLIETEYLAGNKERILRLAAKLLKYQQHDGGFSCMVFNIEERFESSGTALIGLLFVKAYELSLDNAYLQAALAAENALMRNTRRDGTVDFAQGDTKGIGFYSRTFDRMPFAQGMILYLSKKLDKYEEVVIKNME